MSKYKKLFIYIILSVVVAMCFFYAAIYIGGAGSVLAQAAPELENVDDTQSDPDTANVTFFSRIWEFIVLHKEEIFTVVGNIVLITYMIVKNKKSKTTLMELGTNLTSVKTGVNNTATLQNNVVEVTNELIEGYNKFETAINNFDSLENERYKTMLTAAAQTKAILEILTTVYANSKNLPQGVKDLVNLKYADVLKLVSDSDEAKLKEATDNAIKPEE